jgi:hypothetical protein
MNADGQIFLDQLADSSSNGFQRRFSRISTGFGLGVVLDGDELSLLYEATFYATLCNIAFNGVGGCGGEIKPEREAHRMKLEREFMAARDTLRASAGWKCLSGCLMGSIQGIFLNVFVAEDNLAG